jgi:serine/threonine protein kinase/tetratricopeptide (TPR) repeat protein
MNEESLFAAALQKASAAERRAFLDEACAGDAGLRQRLERLLAADAETRGLLEQGQNAAALMGAYRPEPPLAAERPFAGRFKLLRKLGEGGMGEVWLADQTEPVRRQVALKVVRPGLCSDPMLARFEAERQALALMDHPNIARVLDAGVADGRPFFVMELIEGAPITQYCDERRLTPRQRLELFVPVCQAVQHAHQKGVIHRDLKPSNVLVAEYDDRPVAKVIDFGVAKAAGPRLTERTLFTEFGQVVGTLEYMSPEQAELNQLDVDTRSDVYSLGVLLYELLTGATPLEKKRLKGAAMLEALRLIREEEPPKPSTRLGAAAEAPSVAASRGLEPKRLAGLLRGELDWVVMKALEKDRNRRYETASAFAADVQRYLADEPVLACPPSPGYRLRKFVRRNKRALASAGLLGVMLLVVVAILGWAVRDRGAREQEAARDRATRQAVIKERVSLALEEARKRHKEGRWREALDAAKRAEALAATGESDEETRHSAREILGDMRMLASLEHARAEATRNEAGSDLKAEDSGYARALREYGIDLDTLDRDTAATSIRARPIRYELAVFLDSWSQVRRRLEQKGAKAIGKGWKELLEIARAVDPDPWRDQFRKAVLNGDRKALIELAASAPISSLAAETVDRLGDALMHMGATAEAAAFLKKGQLLHPQDYWINVNLGLCLNRLGQRDDATRYFTAAVSLRPEAEYPRYNLATVLSAQGRHADALPLLDGLLAKADRPGDPLWMYSMATGLYVQHFARLGDLVACRAAAERLEKRHPADPMSLYNAACCRALIAAAQARAGGPGAARLAKEEADRAMGWLRKAVAAGFADADQLRQDADLDPLRDREDFRKLLAVPVAVAQARSYIRLSQWEKAAAAYAKADLRAPRLRDDAFAYACLFLIRGDSEGYARFCQGLIRRAAHTEDPWEAYVLARSCAVARKSPVDPARAVQWGNQAVARDHYAWYFHTLGLAQYRAGQFDQALQSFTKSKVKEWTLGGGLNWFGLALVHHRLGHPDEARRCLAKGIQWLEREGPPGPERPAKIDPLDWVEAQLLRREAEEVLKIKLSP